MKLVILILANDNDTYLPMQKLWKTYMNTHPHVKSYFIKYNENLQDNVVLDNDTIFIKGRESLIPGCLDKTIKSIEYVLTNCDFDFDFDFIFRSNMSSVVDLNKLYNLLNKDIECSGVIGIHNDIKFISGAGILINRNTCKLLIDKKASLDYNIIDDVSIGQFLVNNNINIKPLTRFDVLNYHNNINLITKESIHNFYHFRCKTYDNNNNTAFFMKHIIELLYNVN